MSQLLILASYHSRKAQCLTAHDLAMACADTDLQTVLLDLTPRPPRSRQRGRAGRCDLPTLLTALADGAADLVQMTSSTKVPGLSVLAARPGVADDPVDADAVTELFTKMCERFLATYDRVVVVSPPPVDGLQAARLLVVPLRRGRCDVIRDVINPLKGIGILADREIAGAPDLLVATLVPGWLRRHVPEQAPPMASAPTGDDVAMPALQADADTDDVVTRCYYLSAEAIGSLKVFARTLSDRTDRHITLSELVGVAVRTSRILDEAEQLGRPGPGQARTFYLRRSTLNHLSQLALLASRALGRHVRLSDVVDLAIRLLCAQPLDQQVELLEANRRKREHRA